LFGAVKLQCAAGSPRGCLVIHGALACGEGAESIRQDLIGRRAAMQSALSERLKRAQSEGDLPANYDAADLARYIAAVTQGISVQAASGATRQQLTAIAETALRAWPV
jgi:hypothetical protein